MNYENKFLILSIIFFILCLFTILGDLTDKNFKGEDKIIELNNQIEELEIENKRLEKWTIECHSHWEDRYNMRSEKDYEELLIYVDYYVRQKNIIEGMLCENDCKLIQSKDSWRIDYANLYENFCFGCSPYKERHEHLLKEVEGQWGCNNCY